MSDALFDMDACDTAQVIASVPGIPPRTGEPNRAFSSQAGLATLRGLRTRATLSPRAGSRF
ncbi:hypothetical protein [Microbacterium sp. XT11]|uniref:hypothetical protein n=1 Tax=Microbacterium sp. XT11 TaxID=367477 RepID=UPI00083276D2|nr:hypothetical protein [Microbacterium sp. XT11]